MMGKATCRLTIYLGSAMHPRQLSLRLTSKTLLWGLLMGTSLGGGFAWAGPEGGVLSGGSATIGQNGLNTTIHQNSGRVLIDWQSFNVGQNESVNFVQPNAGAIAINRIHDANPSTILGQLNANGQIMLINPNGMVFGNGAKIDVGSLVVSTASPTESDAQSFVSGQTDKLKLSVGGNPDAKILNLGTITAKNAGLVGFVAPNVINNGVIIANKGSVQLASGDTATVDLYGDGLVDLAVSNKVKQQLIEQHGWVQADGGKVLITAAAGEHIVNSVINMGGVTQAHSVEQQGGKIILKGDNSRLTVTGKMDASGYTVNQKGGAVTATAKHITLKSTSAIDVSGDTGGGSIKIGGDYKGQGPLVNAQTVTMDSGAVIHADAVTRGDGGQTILWSDDTTHFYGEITGTGGALSGKGGFVETSGKQNLLARGHVDLTSPVGPIGTWLLDPTNITIYGNATGGTDNINTFTRGYLETQSASANIALTADNNITLDMAGETMTLANNRNFSLTAGGSISNASAGTITTQGTGTISMTAASIALGSNLLLNTSGTGTVTLQSTSGALTAGPITSGGNVTLNAVGNMALGAITTSAGRNVSVTATGSGSMLTASAIDVGTGGSISLVADDIDLNGDLIGTNTLTVRANNMNRTAFINTGGYSASALNISQADIDRIMPGWTAVNLGGTTYAYLGTSSATTVFKTPVNFTSYSIYLNGSITGPSHLRFTIQTRLTGSLSITSTGAGDIALATLIVPSAGSPARSFNITTAGGTITTSNMVNESGGNLGAGNSVVFNAGAGSITFNGTTYGKYNVSATANAINFSNPWGDTTPMGNLTFNAVNSLSLPSMKLDAGGSLNATVSGIGNSITAADISVGTGGNITLTADDLILNGNLSGTGNLTLAPYFTNRLMRINFYSGDFNIDPNEIARFVDGWGLITFGSATHNSAIQIADVNWTDPIFITTLGEVNFYGVVNGTDNATITTQAPRSQVHGTLTSAGQAINLTNVMATSGTINSNNGNITLGGVLFNTNGQSNLLTVNSGTGNIHVTGNMANNAYAPSSVGKTVSMTSGGTITIDGTIDGGYDLSLNGNSLVLLGNIGATSALGTLSLTSTNSLVLPSITASSVLARTTGAAADLTIGSGKTITSSDANGITLVAGRNFINQAGAGALSAGGSGRWVVYSTNSTGTTGEEMLANDFIRMGCSYAGGCAAGITIPVTGNGLVYSDGGVLTVTPVGVSVTYGNSVTGLNGYSYIITGYQGSDATNDVVTGTLTGLTNYIVGNDVGAYALNYGSGTLVSSLGYSFVYANKADGVNVTPRALTAALTGTVSKVYNAANNATLSSGNYTLSNIYSSDNVVLSNFASGTYADQNVGSVKVVSVSGLTLSGTKASNYTLVSASVSGAIGDITPKGLVVTATAGQGKTYGTNNGILNYTYTGLEGSDTVASFSGALARASGENAGVYAINQGNLSALGNYMIDSFVSDNFTIGKATITITAPNGSRYYGYANPSFDWSDATISGLVNGESGAILDSLSFNVAGSATSTANAGTTHAITLGGFSDNNYTLSGFTNGVLTIAKAPLTISADNQTRFTTGALPTLTASYSGLRNGESQTVVSGLVLNTTATPNSPAGEYVITASGASSANYVISYVNGSYLITMGALPTTIQPVQVVQATTRPLFQDSNTTAQNPSGRMNAMIPSVPWSPADQIDLRMDDPLVTFTPEFEELLGWSQ